MADLNYTPELPKLDEIALPENLLAETESLASQVHDYWAAKRIAEGWTFGPVHDGRVKETPNLVRYQDLPVTEKSYDREIVLLILKLLGLKGYKIEKPAQGSLSSHEHT